jgi:uncharacterized protein YbjT (DUF2867 family)
MYHKERIAVTGAFGYTGKYITRHLIAPGCEIITLTDHPNRPNEFGEQLKVYPFNFNHPERLEENLRGVTTLYNTYWVRFNQDSISYDRAVSNSLILFKAAKSAGVERIVHVSITNPTLDSPLPYFRNKAVLERAIQDSGLSYAIIRPTVIFGKEDILINNIAYLLRKFPVFAIPGNGEYRLQPIFVEDMSRICVDAGHSKENLVLDSVGPDIYPFNALVRLIAEKIGSHALLFHLPQSISLKLSQVIGLWLKDKLLTHDELLGLSENLLISELPPLGQTRLSNWLQENAKLIGVHYASELTRHYRSM